jgi:hypothetical protein
VLAFSCALEVLCLPQHCIAVLCVSLETHHLKLTKNHPSAIYSTAPRLQVANEKLEEVEERARELYDCNQRLEAHVHDLESRKRAPLYQKKQVGGFL